MEKLDLILADITEHMRKIEAGENIDRRIIFNHFDLNGLNHLYDLIESYKHERDPDYDKLTKHNA